MTPTEIHEGIATLREELEHAAVALDRTDAVLGIADETLARAEEVVAESRRLAPVIIAVVGVAAVAVAVVIVWRRRRASEE